MAKIKVGFFIPDMIIGGVESVFIQTLEQMSASGNFDITVFMQNPLQEPFYIDWFKNNPDIKLITLSPLGNNFENAAKYMRFFPLSNIRKIIYGLYKKYRNWIAIHNHICDDLDILIDYKNCSFTKLFNKLPQPKVTWIHGSINFFEQCNLIQHIMLYDKFVCLSDSFINDFAAKYPQYADKFVRIYNPIDCDKVRKLAETKSPIRGKYFACVSRQDYDKDIKTVITAFDKFYTSENAPDVKLVLVGDGNMSNELQKYAKTLQSGKNIIFTGAQPIPFPYMRGAMAHILSSYNEGMGMVLLESAALGVLNISSNCPNGPAEILENGKSGLLFPVGDADELAKIIKDIWHNKISTDIITQNATTSLARFSTSTIALEISNMILQTIKKENNAKNINSVAML